jgi:hypothetical protein
MRAGTFRLLTFGVLFVSLLSFDFAQARSKKNHEKPMWELSEAEQQQTQIISYYQLIRLSPAKRAAYVDGIKKIMIDLSKKAAHGGGVFVAESDSRDRAWVEKYSAFLMLINGMIETAHADGIWACKSKTNGTFVAPTLNSFGIWVCPSGFTTAQTEGLSPAQEQSLSNQMIANAAAKKIAAPPVNSSAASSETMRSAPAVDAAPAQAAAVALPSIAAAPQKAAPIAPTQSSVAAPVNPAISSGLGSSGTVPVTNSTTNVAGMANASTVSPTASDPNASAVLQPSSAAAIAATGDGKQSYGVADAAQAVTPICTGGECAKATSGPAAAAAPAAQNSCPLTQAKCSSPSAAQMNAFRKESNQKFCIYGGVMSQYKENAPIPQGQYGSNGSFNQNRVVNGCQPVTTYCFSASNSKQGNGICDDPSKADLKCDGKSQTLCNPLMFGTGGTADKPTAICVPQGTTATQACVDKTKSFSSKDWLNNPPKINGEKIPVADSWNGFAARFNAACSTFEQSKAAQCDECNILRQKVANLNKDLQISKACDTLDAQGNVTAKADLKSEDASPPATNSNQNTNGFTP